MMIGRGAPPLATQSSKPPLHPPSAIADLGRRSAVARPGHPPPGHDIADEKTPPELPTPLHLGGGDFRPLTSYLDSHPSMRPFFRWIEPPQTAVPFYVPAPCVTFGSFRQRSLRIAHALSSRYHIGRGDVAILDLEPGMDFFLAFIACLYIGAIAVPVYPPNGTNDSVEIKKMSRIVNDVLKGLPPNSPHKVFLLTSRLTDMVFTYSRGFGLLMAAESWEQHVKRIVITSFAREDRTSKDLETIWPEVSPNDVAMLQYTSGSTGDPKGVVITHGQLSAQVWFGMRQYELTPRDVCLSWMPQYHDFGLISNFCYTLAIGCELNVMSPITFLKDPIFWIRSASDLHATILTAPNFAYGHTLKRFNALPRGPDFYLDLSSIRLFVSGAEPINIQLMEKFLEYFSHYGLERRALVTAYGLAEHVILVCSGRVGEDPLAKAVDGRVTVGSFAGTFVDIRIIDVDTNEPLPDGCVGEIWVNSPSKAGGYWGRPELSRDVFFVRFNEGDAVSKSNYLRTGDLGFKLGSDLYFAGRLKDTMKISGRNVFPSDIEQYAVNTKSVAWATRPGGIVAFQIPHPLAHDTDSGYLYDNAVSIVLELVTARGHTADSLDSLSATISKDVKLHTGVRPLFIVFVEPKTLPKTTSGKIRRMEARRRFIEGEMKVIHKWQNEEEMDPTVSDDDNDSGVHASITTSGSECSYAGEDSTADVVCKVLREILGVPPTCVVEPTDSIVALGLESMSFAMLIARLEEHFKIKLHSLKIYDITSINDLSALIQAVKSGLTPPDPFGVYTDDAWSFPGDTVIDADSIGKRFPCSSAQQRVYYAQAYAGRTSYHVAKLFHLPKYCDPELLAKATKLAISQHSAFRTAFMVGEGGKLVQTLLSETRVSVGVEKCTDHDWRSKLTEYARADNARPMECEEGDVARIRVYDLGRQRGVAVYVNVHHYIMDARSVQILFNDVDKAYRALNEHGFYNPVCPPYHYVDFALWENALFEAKAETLVQAEAHFWKSAVEGLSPLAIPPITSRSSPKRALFRTGDICDAETLEKFLEYGRRHNCTPFVSLLSVFLLLVSWYSGQDEFTVATPLSRRDVPEALDVFGIVTNTAILPVRLGAKSLMTMDDLVLKTREMFSRVAAHAITPLETVSAAVANLTNGAISLASHCRALFVYHPRENFDPDSVFYGKENIVFPVEEFRFPFNVFLETGAEGSLRTRFIIDPTKYNASIADRFAADLGRIIKRAVSCLERHTVEGIYSSPSVRELYYVSDDETRRILEFGNGPLFEVPSICMHDLIELRVRNNLSQVAVEDPYRGISITYEELLGKSTKMAATLASLGVKSNCFVGLLMDRCPEAIVCMMATWKAGGAYIPIDPTFPTHRILSILQRAKPTVLLTMKGMATLSKEELNGCIALEYEELLAKSQSLAKRLKKRKSAHGLARQSSQTLSSGTNPTDAAYVLFTSGSTGEPKGAVIPHDALVSFAFEQARVLGLSNRSRTLQIPSNSFDASVGEIVETLFAGATLITVSKDILFSRLQEVVLRTKPTYAKFTPTVLALLPPEVEYSFELLHIGGERMTDRLLADWVPKRNVRVIHSYGPTETVVNVCTEVLTLDSEMPVPVGKPYGNTSFYILDPQLRIVPPTFVGELYIGGMQLAVGYLGRDDLTAGAFIPDPFHPGKRLYKSGDLARLRENGSLEILGRKDGQVKIRGQRVEIPEIVNVLLKHESVAEAAVVQHDSSKQLVAYFVSRTSESAEDDGASADNAATTTSSLITRPDAAVAATVRQLTKHASGFLPVYMVPSAFIPLSKLPLTSSAKVDLRRLQSMDIATTVAALQEMERHVDDAAAADAAGAVGNSVAAASADVAESSARSEVEETLADAWAEVLNVERSTISGGSSFAGLGGDSIAAIKLVSAAKTRGLNLTLLQIAGAKSLAAMASTAVPTGSP
ncbi:hypothetical protein DFJ73DRAFT_957110 [Zopfochytrium polystomum]|nr:hypothetical protein DFJ73DRAFT_957110 [Zopfochytrium polystomum]